MINYYVLFSNNSHSLEFLHYCKKNRVNFPPWYRGNRRTFDSRSMNLPISVKLPCPGEFTIYQLEIPLEVNFTKCESANSTSLCAVLPRQGKIPSARKYCTEK